VKNGETKLVPNDRLILSDPTHVCVVVKDVERTATAYASLFGVGPFLIRQVHTPASRGSVRGTPQAYTLKFGYAKTSTVTIELVETVDGETHYKEFLEKHGEGIHHIGVRAHAPLDEELRRWRDKGIAPLQVNYRDDMRYGWAYMDTQAVIGAVIEIVCDPTFGWWEELALSRDLKGPLKDVT
jgi:methylmalonyl-CoA/ethylmalonyl-CoA epimerase